VIGTSSSPAHAAFPGPNGEIAFRRDTSPGSGVSHIFVMNPDGSGQTDLEPTSAEHSNTFPAWNQDSTKLVFNDDTGLAVMNADGSGRGHIRDGGVHPSWAPSAANMVTFDEGNNTSNDIRTINADGSGDTDLTGNLANNRNIIDIFPAWRPDGTEIAFSSEGRSTGSGIYTMRPDGSAVTKVLGTSWSVNDVLKATLDWSPDGSGLVFADPTDNGGGGGIDIVAVSTGAPTHVINTSLPDPAPHFSPDGKDVAFK